jgi:hypothetical protein
VCAARYRNFRVRRFDGIDDESARVNEADLEDR